MTKQDLTFSKTATALAAEYARIKAREARQTQRKKEILEELSRLSRHEDATIGPWHLTHVHRVGVVSYKGVVKAHLPDLDLEPYRGPETSYWQLT